MSRRGHSFSGELDINEFKSIVHQIKNGNKLMKIELIKNLLQSKGLINLYSNKYTRRKILADCIELDYDHELHTAKKLTGENYDVLFVPKGYFNRNEKSFDIFLSREHIFLEVELKSITSRNPDTIGRAIKEGKDQSSRLVLDIHSKIEKKQLVEGLKSGCNKHDNLKEILLFYKSSFHRLPKSQILGSKMFDIIK